MSKLTPEQAWQHVKALNRHAIYIEPDEESYIVVGLQNNNYTIFLCSEIDWGDLDRYPPAESTYREPTQADVGKMVEVRQSNNCSWVPRKLIAVLNEIHRDRFVCERVATVYDTLWMQARIAVDEKAVEADKMVMPPDTQPIRTAPMDKESWLLMGGEWRKGVWSVNNWVSTDQVRSYLWDLQNQPTHWREIK